MPYCPRCGVEVDPSVRSCPLCTTDVPAFEDRGPGEPAWPSRSERDPALDPTKVYASSAELRSRVFLTIAAFVFTAALAVTAADLARNGAVTWARWPLVSLAALLSLIAAAFEWHRQPALWGGAWALVTAAFLAGLDLCDDGLLGWFPTLGLPLTLLTFGLIFIGAILLGRSRRRGYNLFGLPPALVALELTGIDLLITLWTRGTPGIGWSMVTSLVLVPLALLFFFLHYALHRTPNLKRIFHF